MLFFIHIQSHIEYQGQGISDMEVKKCYSSFTYNHILITKDKVSMTWR